MAKAKPENAGNYALIRSAASMDPRARRARTALREALLELLKEHSFEQITPRQVAAQAGLAAATFYRHHASKEEMLEELAREEVVRLFHHAIVGKGPAGTPTGARRLFSYVEEHRSLWSVLLNGGASHVIRDELMRQALARPLLETSMKVRLPTDLATLWGTTATFELIAWWLRAGVGHSIDEMVGLQVDLVLKPVFELSGVSWPAQ